MADDEKKSVSSAEGTDTNKVIGQSDDAFYRGDEQRPEDQPSPASHATKGMTALGYTEASRLEDTAAQQELDRKAAERAAKEK